MDKYTNGFYNGILSALAVLAYQGEDSLAREIAATVDHKKLFQAADEHDVANLKKLGIVSSNAGFTGRPAKRDCPVEAVVGRREGDS